MFASTYPHGFISILDMQERIDTHCENERKKEAFFKKRSEAPFQSRSSDFARSRKIICPEYPYPIKSEAQKYWEVDAIKYFCHFVGIDQVDLKPYKLYPAFNITNEEIILALDTETMKWEEKLTAGVPYDNYVASIEAPSILRVSTKFGRAYPYTNALVVMRKEEDGRMIVMDPAYGMHRYFDEKLDRVNAVIEYSRQHRFLDSRAEEASKIERRNRIAEKRTWDSRLKYVDEMYDNSIGVIVGLSSRIAESVVDKFTKVYDRIRASLPGIETQAVEKEYQDFQL